MSNQPSPWGNYQIGPTPGARPSASGYPLPRSDQYDRWRDEAKKALGLGIASLVLCCCPIAGAVCGVLAIVSARNAMQSENGTTRGLGMAGMICGIIGLAFTALGILLDIVLTIIDLGAGK